MKKIRAKTTPMKSALTTIWSQRIQTGLRPDHLLNSSLALSLQVSRHNKHKMWDKRLTKEHKATNNLSPSSLNRIIRIRLSTTNRLHNKMRSRNSWGISWATCWLIFTMERRTMNSLTCTQTLRKFSTTKRPTTNNWQKMGIRLKCLSTQMSSWSSSTNGLTKSWAP